MPMRNSPTARAGRRAVSRRVNVPGMTRHGAAGPRKAERGLFLPHARPRRGTAARNGPDRPGAPAAARCCPGAGDCRPHASPPSAMLTENCGRSARPAYMCHVKWSYPGSTHASAGYTAWTRRYAMKNAPEATSRARRRHAAPLSRPARRSSRCAAYRRSLESLEGHEPGLQASLHRRIAEPSHHAEHRNGQRPRAMHQGRCLLHPEPCGLQHPLRVGPRQRRADVVRHQPDADAAARRAGRCAAPPRGWPGCRA